MIKIQRNIDFIFASITDFNPFFVEILSYMCFRFRIVFEIMIT